MTELSTSETERLWAALAEGAPSYTDAELTAAAFNRRARDLFAGDSLGWPEGNLAGASRARVRLHGRGVEQHTVPVRVAVKVLTCLQGAISSLAMARAGKQNLLGAVPTDIRRETELRLFPVPSRGSLVLELTGPSPTETLGEIPNMPARTSAADAAAKDLLAVLTSAHELRGADDLVLDHLRRLGPRVASSLRKLVGIPLDDAVAIDLGWLDADGVLTSSELGPVEAGLIREVITRSRVDTEREVLQGVLSTVSTEDPVMLKVGRERLHLTLGPGVAAADLVPYFDQVVTVEAQVEIVTSGAGADTRRYTLLAIRSRYEASSLDFEA